MHLPDKKQTDRLHEKSRRHGEQKRRQDCKMDQSKREHQKERGRGVQSGAHSFEHPHGGRGMQSVIEDSKNSSECRISGENAAGPRAKESRHGGKGEDKESGRRHPQPQVVSRVNDSFRLRRRLGKQLGHDGREQSDHDESPDHGDVKMGHRHDDGAAGDPADQRAPPPAEPQTAPGVHQVEGSPGENAEQCAQRSVGSEVWALLEGKEQENRTRVDGNT